MLHAIVRPVSESIQNCELTHMDRAQICHETAQQHHDQYAEALRSLGVTIHEIDPLHQAPDAVFVEDILVVVDEVAILTRPGAVSRRGEVDSAIETIARFRPIERIEAPATLEGGDVIQAERTIFVGRSTRTNDAGIAQLREILEPLGYSVVPVDVPGALHLKTAATWIGNGVLLANSGWIDMAPFEGVDVVEVHPDEPFAGNAVRVGDVLLFPAHCPHTAGRLEARGFTLHLVPSTELAKAEGSLTCKSVLFAVADGQDQRTT